MTRRSLRDRNRAAIALDPEAPAPVDSLPADVAVAEPVGERSAGLPTKVVKKPVRREKAAPASGATQTARLGIYLTPEEFTNAKAAYLADWTHGGQADTFARWIAAAIDTHARRTAKQRSARSQLKERADERTGSTRSFSIPIDTVSRMRAAITADQYAGRWPSDSAWCGEAIALAVDAARNQAAGPLPVPPTRLPNRLVR